MNCKFPTDWLLLLALFSVLLGCSGGSDRPATYPVRGKVTYQGKPVAGASVAFLAPGAPRLAVGTTDAAGSFRLTTYAPDDGAVLGTHVVTVRKASSDATTRLPAVEPTADAPVDAAAIEQGMMQSARAMMQARSELPAKYADRKTSDLGREVVEGENNFEFELVD